jgi:hypothetical protein
VLVADDQLIQQASVLALEACGNSKVLLPNLVLIDGGGSMREEGVNSRWCTHLPQLDDMYGPQIVLKRPSNCKELLSSQSGISMGESLHRS